jgi:hypothetical protein
MQWRSQNSATPWSILLTLILLSWKSLNESNVRQSILTIKISDDQNFWWSKSLMIKIFNDLIICRILLTDERMNCYCCLSKMNEKFSSLYSKSFLFIYLLILIFWFIEIHLRIEIFVCHEDFFFWSNYLRSSLSLRFDLIRIAYSFSNSLIFRRSRKSVNLKEIISIEWL